MAARTRSSGALEGRKEPVAGRLEDGAAGLLDGGSQQVVVGRQGEDHRLALLLPEARAPRDVGHQERRGVGRPWLGHVGSVRALAWAETAKPSYRQPSSGATNFRMLSIAWALYSTPS